MAKHYGLSYIDHLEWAQFECEVLTRLKERGTPVADLVRTAAGEPFAVVEGRPLLLFEWAEGGIEWPTGAENAARLGRALAEMHGALDEMPLSGEERSYDLDRLVDRPLRLLEPYAESPAEFEELKEAVALLREKIAAIPVSRATLGPIHGDLHQGNCHFTEEGLAVFDFALCGVGYRAYDLTGYLWPMRDATIEDPAMRTCCDGFLAGYRSARELTPEEEAAIPAFVQIRTLWETGDWVDTGTGRDQPDEVRKAIPYLIGQFGRVRES
jgi:Ser/Thr protein kinase RdoA (MazF antagonist)